jgi:hypothetical protein
MKSNRERFISMLSRFAGLVMLVLVLSEAGSGAALRGQLIFPNGVAAGGITLTVYSPAFGRSLPTRTGPDGMYYLQIPAGGYHLEVWINPTAGAAQLVYQIQVVEPYTDIPPIII